MWFHQFGIIGDMVKEKPNSIRTYDKDGFRRRAACLCFRDQKEEEVCNRVFKIFIIIIFIFIITPHVIMHMNTLYPPLKPLIIIRPFSQLTFIYIFSFINVNSVEIKQHNWSKIDNKLSMFYQWIYKNFYNTTSLLYNKFWIQWFVWLIG